MKKSKKYTFCSPGGTIEVECFLENSNGNSYNFGPLTSSEIISVEKWLSHAVFWRSPQGILGEGKLAEQLCRIKEHHQNGGAQVRNAQRCWASEQLKLVAKNLNWWHIGHVQLCKSR